MRLRHLLGTAPLALAIAAPAHAGPAAPAAPLPPLDLGQTNILDGEGGPVKLLEIIGFGSGAWRLADASGRSVPGNNDQQVVAFVIHPVYVASTHVLGAYPGVEVLVPISRVRNGFAGPGAGIDTGLGDVTVQPFLQWAPNHPHTGSVSVRVALGAVAPAGRYRPDAAVNVGSGAWQLSTYVAATWRMTSRWEISGRAIYDHSGSADGPATDGARLRLHAGGQFALNASASYALAADWRVGLGSYLLREVTPATTNGLAADDGGQRVYALGPVLRRQVGRTTLLLAAYREFGARDRPEGISANLRFQHAF